MLSEILLTLTGRSGCEVEWVSSVQSHCSGWWMAVFGEQLRLASTPALSVLLSVCTRAHTPLFSVTYSPPTLFTRLCFNLRLSDTLANTLQCPDWMHCSHPGSAKERINPTHHWYLKHREAVNSIKRQARSACRQHRYCVSRTFQRRTAVIKFIAISVRI